MIGEPMFSSLVKTIKFQIQYESRDQIFTSFLHYLKDGTLPSIKLENIYEYEELNQSFKIKEIQNLIDQEKKMFNDHEKILEALNNSLIKNRSIYENLVSRDINEYLTKDGKKLMNLPINTLYNIFFQSQTIIDHNLAYKLMNQKFQENPDPTIFVLLQCLDIKHLHLRYLREIEENKNIINNPNDSLSYIVELKRPIFHFSICKNNELNGIIKFLRDQNNGDIPDQVIDVQSNDIYRNDHSYAPKNMLIDNDSLYASAENVRSCITFDFKKMRVKLTGYLPHSINNN